MTGGTLAKWLVFAGLGLCALGALVFVLSRFGIQLGRLPGDIHIEGKNGSFHFPLTTCILISVLGTLILHLLGKR